MDLLDGCVVPWFMGKDFLRLNAHIPNQVLRGLDLEIETWKFSNLNYMQHGLWCRNASLPGL